MSFFPFACRSVSYNLRRYEQHIFLHYQEGPIGNGLSREELLPYYSAEKRPNPA